MLLLPLLLLMQFTRDALIVLAGSKEKGRDFVYWTEVKDIPATDLATIERLWNKFSGGKFGYSVQKVRHLFAYNSLSMRRYSFCIDCYPIYLLK